MSFKNTYQIGKIYGIKRLDSLEKISGQTVAHVTCVKCGKKLTIRPNYLYHDKHTSCTCQNATINRDSKTKLYGTYHNMKYRCYTPTAHEYENYGGRGIKLCDEWLGQNGYLNFKEWALANGYQEGLSIDRIDVDGNYSPDNCRWVTLSENVAASNSDNRKQRRKSNMGTYFAISPDGVYYEFENANAFGRENGIKGSAIRDAAYKNKICNNWNFGFVKTKEEPQSTIENRETELVEYGVCEIHTPEAPSTSMV